MAGSLKTNQTNLIARVFLGAGFIMVPCGLLLGAEPGWSMIGGGLGFSLAGALLLLNRAGRHDTLDRVGTALVAGGIAGMVLAASLSVVSEAQGIGTVIDAMHSLALTAALSGSSMRIFAWVARYDNAIRVRAGQVIEMYCERGASSGPVTDNIDLEV